MAQFSVHMADSGTVFPLILGVKMQQELESEQEPLIPGLSIHLVC